MASAEGMALRYKGTLTATDDTWTYMSMPLSSSYLGGTILCSFKCPDGGTGNTGNSDYTYGWCFAYVFAGSWITSSVYRNCVLRNYGAISSYTQDSVAFYPFANMMNQNIVDDQAYAVTRIDYQLHPDGHMTITTPDCGATPNNTGGTSGKIGDLDSYTEYDNLFKCHSMVETSSTPTFISIYAPGATTWGMTNFGTGSSVTHYQWEKS